MKTYRNFRPFSDEEAWSLFRLAAIAEAIGWTLLILGILAKRFLFGGNDLPVQLAGRVHGTFFMIYIVTVLLVAPSLRWSWTRIIVAGACSVPPYGSIACEQVFLHLRRSQQHNRQQTLCLYRLLASHGLSSSSS